MLLSHSQRGSLGHVEENKSRAFHFQIVPLEMSGANSIVIMQTCAAVNEHGMKDSWGDGDLTLNNALLSSLERLHMLRGLARETGKRCVFCCVQEENGKYCSTKSMKWLSQWDLVCPQL